MSFSGLIRTCKHESNSPVPLKSIDIHVEVRGWTAAVLAELTYVNDLDSAIECQFVFPLSDDASIYHLVTDVDGRKMTAKCRPRKEAEQVYQDAIDFGQTSALLESQIGTPDIFRILLGNLPTKVEAVVKIGFVQPMQRDAEGGILFIMPTVLNPRYISQEMLSDAGKMKEHFHLHTHYVPVSSVPYTMTFHAKINLGSDCQIANVAAINAAGTLLSVFDEDKLTATVTLGDNFVQDHDFGLCVTPAEPWLPMASIEPGVLAPSEQAWLTYDVAAAWFEPESVENKPLGVSIAGDEYWLVIDRSGSMSGSKIEDAKAALLLFVKSLPVGCKFNIVGFGSTYTSLFDTSVKYSDKTVEKAVEHAKSLKADLGGTEIYQPLEYIYTDSKLAAKARQFIVLLTDGQVGDTDRVIGLAGAHKSTSRVFAIGIGQGASTGLVNGLARVSGGLSEFVRNSEDRLQAKVISMLKAATNPPAENLEVSWQITGGKVVSLVPDSLPQCAYQGHPIVQYALIERNTGENIDGLIKLTAAVGGTPLESKLILNVPSLTHSPAEDGLPLHRLAAKARLQELEDLRRTSNSSEVKNKILDISIAANILSEETAFVAVDPTSQKELVDTKERRFIDIERTSSDLDALHMKFLSLQCSGVLSAVGLDDDSPRLRSGGFKFFSFPNRKKSTASDFKSKCQVTKSPSFFNSLSEKFSKLFGTSSKSKRSKKTSSSCYDFASASGAGSTSKACVDITAEGTSNACVTAGLDKKSTTLESLVVLQKTNGSWELTAHLCEDVLGKKADELKTICLDCLSEVAPEIKLSEQESDDLIATLVAIAILHCKFGDKKDEWQMIEQKAIGYVTAFDCFSHQQTLVNDFVATLLQKQKF